MYAAEFNNSKAVIEKLIKEGIIISSKDKNGYNALMYSIENNNYEAFSILLNNGANINYEHVEFGNALNFAILQEVEPNMIKKIIDTDVYINNRDFNNLTPLGAILSYDNYQTNVKENIILELLKNGANVNVKNIDSMPVSHEALQLGMDSKVIIKMFESGAYINSKEPLLNKSLLSTAAIFAKDPEIIEYLLDNGANAKHRDEIGATAMNYAERNENIKNTDVYWRLNDLVFE
jgi:ankyrin repeat protein